MFSVLFEVLPSSDRWDDYLANAKMLRPELEKVKGFIENIRYKSLQRPGWLLSLSSWEDEKAVVRWRTNMRHHEVQEKGRNGILQDYHLRVGQYISDNQLPAGRGIREQRFDQTEVGAGTFATLITAKRPEQFSETMNHNDSAKYLGLDYSPKDGLVDWDTYEAVLTGLDLILMMVWKDHNAMATFEEKSMILLPKTHHVCNIRIIRDYGKYDRREAPQYYPDAEGRESIHA
ncbi:MAG: antibiotic biosynthesis monooxygenase [Nitrospira sp.]|nr:antibiotic biosynthesis monooxygenase [Nitrospira sp.]